MNQFQHIATVIRYHRKRAGLSRVALADLAGIGKTTLFDIEHGKATIRCSAVLQVLQVLNITVRLESPLMADDGEVTDAKS